MALLSWATGCFGGELVTVKSVTFQSSSDPTWKSFVI